MLRRSDAVGATVPDSDPNAPAVSVREAIDHLPPIRAGETHSYVPNHRARLLSELNLKRIASARRGQSKEDSLAENVQRAPLRPLDQFRAFQALREKGKSEEEIAAAFFGAARRHWLAAGAAPHDLPAEERHRADPSEAQSAANGSEPAMADPAPLPQDELVAGAVIPAAAE